MMQTKFPLLMTVSGMIIMLTFSTYTLYSYTYKTVCYLSQSFTLELIQLFYRTR